MGGPAGADLRARAHQRGPFDPVQDHDLVSDQDLEGSGLTGLADQRLELGTGGAQEVIGPQGQRPQSDRLVAEAPRIGERASRDHAYGFERGQQTVGGRLVETGRPGQVGEPPLRPLLAEDLEQRHGPTHGLSAGVGLRGRASGWHSDLPSSSSQGRPRLDADVKRLHIRFIL